jgi:hypothetical protein
MLPFIRAGTEEPGLRQAYQGPVSIMRAVVVAAQGLAQEPLVQAVAAEAAKAGTRPQRWLALQTRAAVVVVVGMVTTGRRAAQAL